MIVLDARIAVDAARDRVFEALTRPSPFGWLPGIVRSTRETREEPAGRWRIAKDAAGTRLGGEVVATSWRPGTAFAWRQAHGDFELHRGFVTVRNQETGAAVLRVHLDIELPFVLAREATEREITAEFDRALTDSLLGIKERAESGAPLR